jgi:hypothetical protein
MSHTDMFAILHSETENTCENTACYIKHGTCLSSGRCRHGHKFIDSI